MHAVGSTKRIGVIGGSDAGAGELEIAQEVGRSIGEAGALLVCGGLGGVMEAACRGASETGGQTLGILPGSDPSEANPYVSIGLATGLGEGRNLLVVLNSDALIAVGGEYGTLSEIAFALRVHKPVIGVGTWLLKRPDGGEAPIVPANGAQEAVGLALELLLRPRHP